MGTTLLSISSKRTSWRTAAAVVLGTSCALVLAPACGDDGATEEAEELPDCALDAEVEGGATASFTFDASWGCASPFGADTGMTMIFLPGDDTIGQIEIDVADVTEGGTGTFPARNGFTSPDGSQRWTTGEGACSVEITSNEKTSEDDQTTTYLVVGSGSCTAAAEPAPGNTGAPIQLGAFELRFPATWFK